MPRDRLIEAMKFASKHSISFSLRLTLVFIELESSDDDGIYIVNFEKMMDFRELKKSTLQKHLSKLCSLGILKKTTSSSYILLTGGQHG